MKAFAYVNPANEKEAVAALKVDTGARALPLAGGQDLLARMKDYIDSPDRVVNVKGLDATIAVVRFARKTGLTIGLGDCHLRISVTASKKAPPSSSPTMTPEFNQSSRSP